MTHNFVFFWAGSSPFSNWHKSKFTHNDVEYNCSEQYMMHMKALMFGDTEVAELIMEQKDPRKQKMLGREVRHFDHELWFEKCQEVMVDGLISKFTQNPSMLKVLLDTGDKIIAEASPYDTVWGIGMAEDHPDVLNQSKWNGHNLLGKVLMSARNQIIADLATYALEIPK